jgi:hypothetical protein
MQLRILKAEIFLGIAFVETTYLGYQALRVLR